MDELDVKIINKKIWDIMNGLTSEMTDLVLLQRNIIFYQLLKNGYVKMEHLVEVSGYSRKRLYDIVEGFEKKLKELNEKV